MINKEGISVVGLGYVGLPLALLASKKGYDVTGIDLNADKVEKINKGEDPIGDDYVHHNIIGTSLKAATDFDSIKKNKIVIICVPTPVKNDYQPDLTFVRKSVVSVAEKIEPGTLIIVESTINPGVCDEVVIPLIEEHSNLEVNKDFYVSHCPERINPGDENWNVENIPRVVGSSDEHGLKLTLAFYANIIDAVIKPMDNLKEAEAVKIVENSFRDVNIAFVNELAMSFTKIGVDVKNVIEGASTKPFAFLAHYPSVGVGGHCIPVDPYYLIEYARGFGFDHEFLALARSINNRMPDYTVGRLIDGLNEAGLPLKGSRVLVLGLSYKPNIADDRESPSYKIIEILKTKGAIVESYDPYVIAKSSVKNLPEAIKNTDAILLATSHQEFLDLDPHAMPIKVFVDGKNVFNSSYFTATKIIYRGIGR